MKKQAIKWTGALSLLLISLVLSAQTDFREIKGKVIDDTGQPLPGVGIILKGGSVTTVSNNAGLYTIRIPNVRPSTLVFSYIGMKTQEINLGNSTVVNVTLEAEAKSLNEVVAIGYGTAKKKDLTGSVAIIDGDDLAKRNQTQLSQALQGAAPGVTATRTSGLPGAGATIRVRGITTIGDSDPLILVDGIPIESMAMVNPQDIENISILKDAASASIYGARASAGVILITTKSAKSNQLNLEYRGMYGVIKPTRFPGTVNHIRYMEMMNEISWNDGGNQIGGRYNVFTEDFINDYNANNRWNNADLYPITNWVDEIINDYAPSNMHGLSLAYGNDFIKTKASVNYEKEDALYNNRSYNRITSRINNKIKINNFLSADLDASMLRSIDDNTVVNPLSSAYKYGPLWRPYWADGRITEGRNGANTWARVNYGGFDNTWRDELTGRMALNFTPVKDLVISGVIAPSIRLAKGKRFVRQVPYYDYGNLATTSGFLDGQLTTSLNESRSEVRTLTKQLTANYNPKIGTDHNLSLLAGYEDYYRFSESLGANSDNFLVSDFPYLNRGSLDFMQNSGNAVENAYNSYFGRAMYDYKGKYLLQANIRYDGSSRFHRDYRWASFPSFSAGWVASEESFFKDLNIKPLNYLKVRASWGTLGNERIGNYPYQAIMNFNNALFIENGIIVSGTSAAQITYNINDITWETTESWNLGIDATFLTNRLTLTADYYQKKTRDMLLALEIPSFMGFSNPDQNAGNMHTKGWEAQLGWSDKIGGLKYSISANLSDYKSMMGNLSGVVLLGDNIIKEGVEYNSWYGYRSGGLFQSQQDIDSSPLLSSVVRPGDVKYLDVSGPNGVPDGKITPEYDRVPLDGSLPRYVYGGNISLTYKGFDAYLMFQGVGKQNAQLSADMVYQTTAWHTLPDFVDGNYYSEYNTPEQNATARYPRLSQIGYTNNNFKMSDFWLFDGSYLRLKNITLGYTLPSKINKAIKVNNLRVYAAVNDLFSVDNYPKGWDPESSISAYIARTWNFGVQVRF